MIVTVNVIFLPSLHRPIGYKVFHSKLLKFSFEDFLTEFLLTTKITREASWVLQSHFGYCLSTNTIEIVLASFVELFLPCLHVLDVSIFVSYQTPVQMSSLFFWSDIHLLNKYLLNSWHTIVLVARSPARTMQSLLSQSIRV